VWRCGGVGLAPHHPRLGEVPLYGVYPGRSSVVYLVMQNRNLEYGGRRCGFNTKHQRTKEYHQKILPKALPDSAWNAKPQGGTTE
jgi:hypothetical protein